MKFAHIVNCIAPADNPSLYRMQEITLESLLRASGASSHPVRLLSAQYDDAVAHLPAGITATPPLHSDASADPRLGTVARVPLLKEILDRISGQDADYYIYSNADICVMPFFYDAVGHFLALGHDALVINRRRIPAALAQGPAELRYAHAGRPHIGFDCFVFRRELLPKFIMRDIYLSAPPAGSDLFYNLFTFASNPALLSGQHLTFHLGEEMLRDWGTPALRRHNRREFLQLLGVLRPHMDISRFPGAGYGIFRRHFKWLMNPALHYPTMAAVDLRQLSRRRKAPAPSAVGGLHARYFEWLSQFIGFRDRE
jgi:hypothetical protein